jgi:DNA polymerase-1
MLWRNFDAFQELGVETPDGFLPTGGIYGFFQNLVRIHERYGGLVVVAWEGTANFRFKLFPDYKKRKTSEKKEAAGLVDATTILLRDDMKRQMKLLEELLVFAGIRQYVAVDGEGDDAIGTLAARAASRGCRVVVYSGDSDLRQLVCDDIVVASPGKQGIDVVYDEEEVEAKHGVPPRLLADFKAISGDSSDGIPGAPGIGPKGAAALLNANGNLESVIEAATDPEKHWIGTAKQREIIATNVELLRLYRKLTKIDTEQKLEARRPAPDRKKLLEHFRKMKFMSLIRPTEMERIDALATGEREEAA